MSYVVRFGGPHPERDSLSQFCWVNDHDPSDYVPVESPDTPGGRIYSMVRSVTKLGLCRAHFLEITGREPSEEDMECD
jgi:hypothetical protein